MTEPSVEVAERAIGDVAYALGVKVDPILIAQLAGLVIGVLSGKKWADAEQAGLERAANITSLEAADALGRGRE